MMMAITLTTQELIENLGSDDYEVRYMSRQALLNANEDVVPLLIETMLKENGRQSWEAAITLHEFQDPRAFEPMITILHSGHPILSQTAAQYLGCIEGYRAISELIDAMPTTKYMTQIRIAEILGKLKARDAVPVLTAMLMRVESTDLMHTIIEALGNIGDPSVMPLIHAFINHSNHHVSKRARVAMEKLAGNGNH